MPDNNFLRGINLDALRRSELGASLNFNEVLPYIERMRDNLLFFEGRDNLLLEVDKKLIDKIYSLFVDIVSSIRNFSVDQNENSIQTQSRKVQIIKNIHALQKQFSTELLSVLILLKLDDAKTQETIKSVQNKILQIDNQFQNKLQTIDNQFDAKLQNIDSQITVKYSEFITKINNAESLLQKASDIKISVENFSIGKLAERYGDIFSKQAIKNKKLAIAYGIIFSVFLISLLFLTFGLFNPILQKLGDINNNTIRLEYMIANVIFRLTILGIAFVFVKESLKNFNINMHLYNLNLHRENSLHSFDTLISTAQRSETKDQIIKEIAQTIYANQDDGYLSVSNKKGINVSEAIELIKALK